VARESPSLMDSYAQFISCLYHGLFDLLFIKTSNFIELSKGACGLPSLFKLIRRYAPEDTKLLSQIKRDENLLKKEANLDKIKKWRNHVSAHLTRSHQDTGFFDENRLHLDEIEDVIVTLEKTIEGYSKRLIGRENDTRYPSLAVFNEAMNLLSHKTPRLFSYVVDHDCGYAPNPYDGYCTLAQCMYGKKSKNIADIADPGDWVVGTGGVKKASAGHGKIVYVMRVDEKMSLAKYYLDPRFKGRIDNLPRDKNNKNRYALISQHYFYFGINAIPISKIPQKYLDHPLEKKGPRYRYDFDPRFIQKFITWLERKYDVGMHGDPCGSFENTNRNRLKCQPDQVSKNETLRNPVNGNCRTQQSTGQRKPGGFPCR